MENYIHPEVITDTQWIAEHLTSSNLRLVDVGYDLDNYESGHIPGAVGWGWSTDFQHPIRKDLPDKSGMEALLNRSGIERDTKVVVYGTCRNAYATFAFWLLKIYGYSDVRFMDGNREKWITEERPMTLDIPEINPSIIHLDDADWSIRAGRERVMDGIGRPDKILVDVRTPEEYHGELWDAWKFQAAASQRGGHIPGAVNIPWNISLNDDGTLKSAEELQEIYSKHGVTPEKEVITYCIVGGRSNLTWFILRYLLGYPNVRLYDGSWAEWSTLVGAPIEL